MKDFLWVVGAVVLIALLSFGGWRLERYINYKWNYQSAVQSEIDDRIKPLTERVQKLEVEIQVLKTNK